jgi:DNA-binding LacI/PurR family transcriptional regulator
MATRRPTSSDVARAAGVSRATVSYVLNGTANQSISDATRGRVLEAARALQYMPSASARSLRSGRSDVVLGILPDWPIGYTLGALIHGLSTYLREHGLTFVVHSHPRDAPMSALWASITPGAIVLLGPLGDQDMASVRAVQGVVAVDGTSPQAGTPVLSAAADTMAMATERVGRLQVEHLVFTGHRRIGFAYPDDPLVAVFAEGRLAGARVALAELGLEMPVVATTGLEPEAARRVVEQWLAQGVTAVCAYNDELALAVLAGMRLLHLSAPGDLAVIGVDDIPAARLAAPALTTVWLNVDDAVLAIGSQVVHGMGGAEPVARLTSASYNVVVRDSA